MRVQGRAITKLRANIVVLKELVRNGRPGAATEGGLS
jgi:hypothetical protein